MKMIRRLFYVAIILVQNNQVSMAQVSETLSGQAWLNKNDGSLIVKFEKLDKLNGLDKPLQDTPALQGFFKDGIDHQETPYVEGPDSTGTINSPTNPEEYCDIYPFLEGCN